MVSLLLCCLFVVCLFPVGMVVGVNYIFYIYFFVTADLH